MKSIFVLSLLLAIVIPEISEARGKAVFPDVMVQAGQEFYVTAIRINRKDSVYYGDGGVCTFSGNPDPNWDYGFDVENGVIYEWDSSTYVAPLTTGEYRVDCYWWSPVPPYDAKILLGTARIFVTP